MFGVDYVLLQLSLKNLNRDHITFALNLSLLVNITISILRSISKAVYLGEDIGFSYSLRENLTRFLIVNHFIDARLGYVDTEPNPANIGLAKKYGEVALSQLVNYQESSIISPDKREKIKSDMERLTPQDFISVKTQVKEFLDSNYYGVDMAI